MTRAIKPTCNGDVPGQTAPVRIPATPGCLARQLRLTLSIRNFKTPPAVLPGERVRSYGGTERRGLTNRKELPLTRGDQFPAQNGIKGNTIKRNRLERA
ncbi:unnamed protein product [Mesocestoides corti]|uniref:Uncharacterized protein n=1 Tax=Mesocestoides corti TaxID=53468 RepID=A0A0R3U1T7_MESCO|nr:unnamed protein product [Mesocestoides corti]